MEDTIKYVPFRYKLLRCKDYSKIESGYCFAKFDNRILNVVIGDYILQVCFDLHSDFPNEAFWGAEVYFEKAAVNHGTSNELVMEVGIDEYKKIAVNFVQYAAKMKREAVERKLNVIWVELGQNGQMPAAMVNEFFEKYYSEEVKIGDRHESKRFAEVLTSILAKYFNIENAI